jgi:NarL family two-component system sensor histidine kinase YdfH
MKRFWLSPRWLFYGWVGLVYLWGLINYAGSSVGEVCHRWESLGEACYTTFLPGMSTKPLSLQFWAGPDLAAFLIFTLSMALVALLDWVILTSKVEGSFSWLAYLLLGGLVLIAKLAIQGDVSAFGDEIALALYLTLLLQAYSQLKNLRLWFIVGAGYFILFQFGSNLDGGWQYVWQTRFPYISWGVLFSLLVIIVAFYLEQLHSHRRLALTHHQLKTTYEQLTDSARQIKALTLLTERQRLARELHDT